MANQANTLPGLDWDPTEFEKTIFELKSQIREAERDLPDPGTVLSNGMYGLF